MSEWEYDTTSVHKSPDHVISAAAARIGWELVSVVPELSVYHLFFKRRKQEGGSIEGQQPKPIRPRKGLVI